MTCAYQLREACGRKLLFFEALTIYKIIYTKNPGR
jgi:hypothetical protein